MQNGNAPGHETLCFDETCLRPLRSLPLRQMSFDAEHHEQQSHQRSSTFSLSLNVYKFCPTLYTFIGMSLEIALKHVA